MKTHILILILAITLSGCYTMEYTVGKGSQTGEKVEGHNHYLVNGLVKVKTTDPTTLAGGATDYNVKITHRFIDSLCCYLTYGIYCPYSIYVTN